MQKANRTADGRLKRLASVLWLAAAVMFTLLVCILVFYRNPWITHRISADQLSSQLLDQLAESRSPYVRADRMDLTFTGYYETDRRNAVRAYCYMGDGADCKVLILLPATDGGRLLEEDPSEMTGLKDVSVKGRVIRSDEITGRLAEAEQMSVGDYRNYYGFTGIEIHDFHSDQEQMRIYQLMLGVFILGALITGVILRSEAVSAREEADGDEKDQMEDD